MDATRDYHTKGSKLEKDKYITYMWNQKDDTNEVFLQNRNRFPDLEIKSMVTKGETQGEVIN